MKVNSLRRSRFFQEALERGLFEGTEIKYLAEAELQEGAAMLVKCMYEEGTV